MIYNAAGRATVMPYEVDLAYICSSNVFILQPHTEHTSAPHQPWDDHNVHIQYNCVRTYLNIWSRTVPDQVQDLRPWKVSDQCFIIIVK